MCTMSPNLGLTLGLGLDFAFLRTILYMNNFIFSNVELPLLTKEAFPAKFLGKKISCADTATIVW